MKMIPFWQRLLITVAIMLVTSYLAGIIWQAVFGFILPSYVAGLAGGLSALPAWDFLKRVRPGQAA
jgi:hypothetical protein